MKFHDYQELAKKTAIYGWSVDSIYTTKPHREGAMNPRVFYVMAGLVGEVGEVCEKIKKVLRDKEGITGPEDLSGIKKELGDVLWYLSAMSTELGFSLEDVANANISKLLDRNNRGVVGGGGDDR